MIIEGLGGFQLTGFDGLPGSVVGGTGCLPHSGGTAAESFVTDGFTAEGLSWSHGTVGESFLTSGSGGSDSWCLLVLDEFLDCLEIFDSRLDGFLESGPVAVILLDLALKDFFLHGVLSLVHCLLGFGSFLNEAC